MSKIIALRGRGSIGKTTTIRNHLHGLMLQNGFKQVPNCMVGGGTRDIYDVFEKNGIRYGISSSGDTHDHVMNNLTDLISDKCDIMVCACRTRGGTHAALHSFNIPVTFVDKQIGNSNNQSQINTLNQQDAQKILNLL